ncbi:AfsR/SARP family transcriptional regulator [Micromonospora arborensis]|uniref:AfsR/SARP family transcriptional regulator n=1 Tax=Micromonospora arborensis TaxID=2116518 RepID=UPI0037132F70
MRTTFEFRLLGPVEAWGAERRVALGERRQRCIAAVLLTEANQVVSADTLVERVWGEQPPASVRSALYSYLTRIKTVLRRLDPSGGQVRLIRAAGGYLLEVDPDAVDLHRFGRLVDQARRVADLDQAADTWAAALRLWRGIPYQDLTSFWLDQMRDTLEEQRLTALSERNDIELARGRHSELLTELTEVCRQQPFDERLAGQRMLAAYRCGRQAEALGHFQTVRRRLVDELGVDPGRELSTLYEQILRHDPALAAPPGRGPTILDRGAWAGVTPAQLPTVPRQLPADVIGFAGRHDHLRHLDGLLSQQPAAPVESELPSPGDMRPKVPNDGVGGESRAVVVSVVDGTAGVGKTALAVHWAHTVASRFPDGQLYVNLRGFDPSGQAMDPAEAIRGFLDALGVPSERIPRGLDAQTGLYRSLTAGKHLLILLDNAHNTEQVRPLLPATSTCLAVVTSRNPLTGLIATHGVHPLTLDVLSDDEARQVLVRRLGADRVKADPTATGRIITACARLPLALAIAAARAQQTRFPLTVIAAELHGNEQRLDALDVGDPTSQIRAAFSWSYTVLTPAAARLFRLLGLHPGPDIDIAAAANLAGYNTSQAQRSLAELVRASLLTEHVPGRYIFHDLLRAYATELTHILDTDQERHAAATRVLDYYLHTAHTGERLLYPTRHPINPIPAGPLVVPYPLANGRQAMHWLSTERLVLLATIEHAAGTGFDAHAWQLSWTLNTFFFRRGHWRDLVTAGRTAVTAADRLGDPEARLITHRLLADAYTALHRFDDAHIQLQHALAVAVQAGDCAGQGQIHLSLGRMWDRRGDPRQTLDHCYLALDLFEASGDRIGRARTLNGIGWCHALLGEYEQALVVARQALTLNQGLHNRVSQANTWDTIGYALHQLGRHTEAITSYENARDLFHNLDNRVHEAQTLTRLGETHHTAGDISAARHVWKQALTILDDLHHPDATALRAKLNPQADGTA